MTHCILFFCFLTFMVASDFKDLHRTATGRSTSLCDTNTTNENKMFRFKDRIFLRLICYWFQLRFPYLDHFSSFSSVEFQKPISCWVKSVRLHFAPHIFTFVKRQGYSLQLTSWNARAKRRRLPDRAKCFWGKINLWDIHLKNCQTFYIFTIEYWTSQM